MTIIIGKVGSEFLVNTETADSQNFPTITALSNGGFMVAWQDLSGTLGDNSGLSIKAQLFDVSGTKVGPEFRVNTQIASDQSDPTVTGLANGGFVVTWRDLSGTLGDSSGSSIKAQVFDASGNKVGSEFLVNTQVEGDEGAPSITGLTNGGFVVTWYGPFGGKAQVFDASGAKVGSELFVNTLQLVNESDRPPTVTALTNGGFVVTWPIVFGTQGVHIEAQVFDASGAKVGSEFVVTDTSSLFPLSPSVTGLTNGGFVVTWRAFGDNSGLSIKAQLFDASGNKVGSEFLVNTETADSQNFPTITALSNGGFVVAWQDPSGTLGDSSESSIKAQVFDASGAKVDSEFLVNTQTAGSQDFPTVTPLTNGGFVITWQDLSGTLGDSSGSSIKAQLFAITDTNMPGILDSILDTEHYGPFTSGANFNQVNALIYSSPGSGLGYRWLDTTGPLTITYSFIGGSSAPRDPAEYNSMLLTEFTGEVTALSGSQQGNVRQALAVWEQYANVDFVLTSETASSVGDIRFGMSTVLRSDARAVTLPPLDSGLDLGGALADIWFQSDIEGIGDSTFAPGTAEFRTTLHELGHAVFGFTDVSNSDVPGLGGQLSSEWDTTFWTVMSYNSEPQPNPITPMYLDILAAHRIYGDVDIFTGDDTHTVNADSLVTIWDDGGNDTIVWNDDVGAHLSLQFYDERFNVHPSNNLGWSGIDSGAFESSDWRFFIAPGTLIENLTGGSGNDWLEGNGADNIIDGGLGADAMAGGSGNDTYILDVLGDTVIENAGEGTDTVNVLVNGYAVPVFDLIHDYNQGNTGLFSAGEGDQLDLSVLLAAAYNGGAGQPVRSLVRVVEDASATGSLVQVDTDGVANGNDWTTIAQLDDVHLGHTVNVILDGSQPAGVNLTVLTNAGALGDFNGDGTDDVLWRNDDGTSAIWQMNAGAVNSVVFPTGVPNDWHIVGIGDFNGDNTDDVLWRNDNGTVLEWLMNNNAIGSAPVVETLSASTMISGIADFNNDGKDDILLRTFNGDGSTTISVQLMNSGTVASSGTTGMLPGSWNIVGVGDFNGDDFSDILFREEGSGTTAVWEMNGTALASAIFEPGVPTDWHVVGTGDFNGDNINDILWANDSGIFATWLMNASAQPQSTGFFGVGTDWHVTGIGDVNSDGNDDLLWKSDSGATAISLMDGATASSTTFPGGVPAEWQPITHHYDFV